MALHLRKLLSAETDPDNESPAGPCDNCYNCDSNDCPTPPPQTIPHHGMPTVLIVMLCVLAIAVLVLSYLVVGRYRNYRRRSPRAAAVLESEEESRDEDEDQGGSPAAVDHHVWYIRTVGFPQKVIDSIPVFKYRRGESLIDGTDCSVCLNEFEEDESLRLLPKCSHAFHLPCIDTWLRAHKNCPVCRAPIMLPRGVHMPPGNSMDATRPVMVNQAIDGSESNTSREIRAGLENGSTMPIQGDTMKTKLSLNLRNGNFRVFSDLADHRAKMDRVFKPIRRSASLDFSMVCPAMVNKQGHLDKRGSCKNLGIYRLIKSASLGRTLQKGPVPMKRSLSLRTLKKNSGKRFGVFSTLEIGMHSMT